MTEKVHHPFQPRTPTHDLSLPSHVIRRLETGGFDHVTLVYQAAQKTPSPLLEIPFIGPKTLDLIRDACETLLTATPDPATEPVPDLPPPSQPQDPKKTPKPKKEKKKKKDKQDKKPITEKKSDKEEKKSRDKKKEKKQKKSKENAEAAKKKKKEQKKKPGKK